MCIYTGSLSFCLWQKPMRAHMLRHTCRGMNRFKVFTLYSSPETSPLVSHRWEHPLGKLCSYTWFHVCFPMSAWAQQRGQPLSRCPVWSGDSWQCPCYPPDMLLIAGPGQQPCRACCKPLLQTLPLPQQWSQHRPQTSPVHQVFQSLPSEVVPIFACIMV